MTTRHNLRPTKTALLTGWLCLLTLLAVTGCKETTVTRSLSEKEYYYDDRLSAIARDTSGYWIGGETGIVWHVERQERKRFDTGLDRIYDLERDPAQPGMLWIASRNAGLQRWQIAGDTLIHRTTYEIPRKGSRYSPYDIAIADSTIFIATSQGLYSMPITPRHGRLTRLYPSAQSGTAREGKPFLVNSLCHEDGRWLFAATQDGIISLDLRSRRMSLRHRGRYMRQAAIYDHRLYALAEGQLTVEALNGSGSRTFALPQPALSFYKVGATHYFISSSSMQLSEDLERFVTVPLRHNVPANPHKTVIPDDGTGFSVMLAENAVWRIPHHLGILNGDAPTIAACMAGNDFIYVNNRHELFRQRAGQLKASKIYDFGEDDLPIGMCAIGQDLFYYNASNQLCRLTTGNNYLINQLLAHPEVIFQPDTRITAMVAQPARRRILLGVQDYLLAIDTRDGKADTVPCMSGKYITAFHKPQGSDDIYLSTLNDGVFFGNGDRMRPIPGTERKPFIRSLLTDEGFDRKLILLTNHQLEISGTDSLRVDGCSRIFGVDDSIIYTIPEFGIHKYVISDGRLRDRGSFFTDIRFNAQAGFVSGGELFVGSDLGVIRLRPGREEQAGWIAFDDDVPSLRLIGLTAIALLCIIGIALTGYVRQRRSEHRQLQLGKDDLRRRLAGLITMQSHLNEPERTTVDEINREIDDINITSQDIRKTNEQIAAVSARIMRLNRDAALQMVKYLNQQMERISQIDLYDRPAMIKASQQARDAEDIDGIIQQCSSNEMWLNHIQELTERLEKFGRSTEGTLVLQGLNDGMKEDISRIMDGLRHHPVAEMHADFIRVRNQYERIFTSQGLAIIRQYVTSGRERLRQGTAYPHVVSALMDELDDIEKDIDSRDRIVLLRTLKTIDCRMAQISLLEKLRGLMQDFTGVHDTITRENEERRMRKFDSKLFAEIDSATRDITDRIAQLSADFFALFTATDREVSEDIFHFTAASSQQVRVLTLLLASPKVKRTLLPGMLGIYGNLNPVVSRLYHGKIGDNQHQLNTYCKLHPASIVYYILKLPE